MDPAPAPLPLSLIRGVNFGPVMIHCKDAGDVAVPLAGWKAFAEVRKDPSSSLVLDLTPVIDADDAEGLITLPEILHAATAVLAEGSFAWDLILEDPTGRRLDPIAAGPFTIESIQTQPVPA